MGCVLMCMYMVCIQEREASAMLEFIQAFLSMVIFPEEIREYHWKMEDGGTTQYLGHHYNRVIAPTTGRYAYHGFEGSDRLFLYDEDLNLSYAGFDWKDYRGSEKSVLQPQLEALGFRVTRWGMGEYDSFGPLSRTAQLVDVNGVTITFSYG